MTDYEDRTILPPPEQRITVLHVWIATQEDGSEGILSADMRSPIGTRHMPLMSGDLGVAERLGLTARKLAAASKQPVSVRMATFRLVSDA